MPGWSGEFWWSGVNKHTREWQHVTDRVRSGQVTGLQCPKCAGQVLADWAPFDHKFGGEFHLLCDACGAETYVLIRDGDSAPEHSPGHYELEIDHPLLINDVPAGHYIALEEELNALPWWRRLLVGFTRRFRPLLKSPGTVTNDRQPLSGTYETQEAALAAAERIAREKTGEIHPWATVNVVAVKGASREVVDGVYPNDGGHI